MKTVIAIWGVGKRLPEYEQKGADRAEYGSRLLENLSSQLTKKDLPSVAPRTLRQYRQFYLVYPWIWQTGTAKFLLDNDATDNNGRMF